MAPLITPTLICLLIGGALALRFKFIVLLPATIVTLLLSSAVMLVMGFGFWQIMVSSIAEATALQVGYVAGAMLLPYYRRCYRRIRRRRASTKSD